MDDGKYWIGQKSLKIAMKRQPSEWEKTIAIEAIDRELISKIYKQFL